MRKNREPTPAQKRRNVLAEAIRLRGEAPFNIWVVRPPFDDKALILSSDAAMELFYFLEGEPRLTEVDYSPLRRTDQAGSASKEGREFAHARTGRGNEYQIFLSREIAPVADYRDPFDTSDGRIEIRLPHLDANTQRTENWRRIIPCIRRVRRHPISALELQILLRLRRGPQTIRQLTRAFLEVESPALLYGAIACVLRKRQATSDCDTRPWSLNTLIQSTES